MTDTEKAEYENIVRLLTEKLRETVDENDRLKALVANLTEGANALSTLQSLYRNGELPAVIRAKCAAASLQFEVPKLMAERAPLDLTAEGPPEPLADVVHRQRARANRMQREARNIQVLPSGQVLLLEGNGSGDSSSND